MSRFRYFYIPDLVWQLLRSNYTARNDYPIEQQTQPTTYLYRFLVSCAYIFNPWLKQYYRNRSKQYMFGACTPTYGQIQRVLRYWYNYDIEIVVPPLPSSPEFLYWEDFGSPVYFYWEDTPQKFLYWGSNTTVPILRIPTSLAESSEYAQFIADINLLIPFTVKYTIQIY